MSDPSDPPPSPSERMPEEPPPMTVLAALGWSFGITFAFHLLATIMLKLRPGSTIDIVGGALCQAVAYLAGLFLILRVHAPEASIRDFIGLRGTHPAFYPVALLLGVAVWLPAEALESVIEKRWPSPEGHLAEQLIAAPRPYQVAMLLMITVVGPLMEELLFRGALFRALRRMHPQVVVIVATASLFGMAHMSWKLFFIIGGVGLALGLVRAESGSLIPGLLLHFAFNAMTCALLFYSKAKGADVAVPNAFVPVSVAVAALLLVLVRFLGARSATAAAAREMDRR